MFLVICAECHKAVNAEYCYAECRYADYLATLMCFSAELI
jgi:hypothetical protein